MLYNWLIQFKEHQKLLIFGSLNVKSMKTNQKLSILFWINTPKLSQGKAPIYVRVTIDSQRSQWSLGRRIDPEKWNKQAGKVKGNNEDARTLNAYINYLRGELQRHYNLLCSSNEHVTAEKVRNAFLGKTVRKKTLVEAFEYHNLKMKEVVSVEKYSPKTLQRYEITLNKVRQFMEYKYNVSDMFLEELKYALRVFAVIKSKPGAVQINPEISGFQKLKSRYDVKTLPYFYKNLKAHKTDFKEGISKETRIGTVKKTKIVVEREIAVPINRIFELISNFKYRKIWDKSLTEIRFNETPVNRVVPSTPA